MAEALRFSNGTLSVDMAMHCLLWMSWNLETMGEGGEVLRWAGLVLEVGNTFPCTVLLQGRNKIFCWGTQCTREYFSSY